MMSFRLSSEAAESGFPEKSSRDAHNAPDPKSPRDTPYGSRDKWQNKTHILSFNPLIENGLRGVDRPTLERRIEQVGYFRLKGYWYPFLTPTPDRPAKRVLPFREGTRFQDIWNRYVFDQELRVLVFDGIITIEIHLKSFLAHELSLSGGGIRLHDTGRPSRTEL